MITSQGYCLLFALFLLERSRSVLAKEERLVRGCLGESVTIWENISMNGTFVVSVYKAHETSVLLGMWKINNGITRENGYSERIDLDTNGNIELKKLVLNDEANYTLQIKRDPHMLSIHNIHIEVMVAPTKQCKPNITKAGDYLFAELYCDTCGKPSPSVKWKNHIGKYISEHVIQLLPGNNYMTYTACIEGESLQCLRSSNPATEFCAHHTNNNSHRSPESSTTTTVNVSRCSSESTRSDVDYIHFVISCLIMVMVAPGFIQKLKNTCSQIKTYICRKGSNEAELVNNPNDGHESGARGNSSIEGGHESAHNNPDSGVDTEQGMTGSFNSNGPAEGDPLVHGRKSK